MNNNPSIDPANNGSLAGSIKFAFNKLTQQKDGMLPAKVIEYDREENRVQVQLLITLITTDGSQVPRPQIASLPVILLGGGGYFLGFPLAPGDLGWVMANDRDISIFLQSYAQSPPNTERVKSFSDGIFIPDIMTGYTIDGVDDNNFIIQNKAGTEKITIGAAGIKVQSAVEVKVTAPLVTVDASTVSIASPAISINMTLPTNIIQLNGSILATGTIHAFNIP